MLRRCLGRVLRAWIAVAAAGLITACGQSSPTASPAAGEAPPRRPFLLATGETFSGVAPSQWWVDGYAIESDGRLVPTGPRQFLPVDSVQSVFSDTQRRFVYFGSSSSSGAQLLTYEIATGSGALKPLGRSTGLGGWSRVALHPSGRFLYKPSGSFEITGYEIDTKTGLVVGPLPGSPFRWSARGGNVVTLQAAPSGRFLWATALWVYKSQSLVSFRVDPSSGTATFSGDQDVVEPATNLAVDAHERFAYLIDNLLRWRGYSIDPADGALTPLPHSPRESDGRAGRLLATRSGRWLIREAWNNGPALESFEITTEGRLDPGHTSAPLAGGAFGDTLDLLQEGPFVYFVGWRGLAVAAFDEEHGTFTPVQSLTLPDQGSIRFATLVPLPRS